VTYDKGREDWILIKLVQRKHKAYTPHPFIANDGSLPSLILDLDYRF